MRKNSFLSSLKKTTIIAQVAVIASAALLPAILLSGSASGAQLVERRIDMSASGASTGSGASGTTAAGQNVTYTVSFELATNHSNLEGIVIDFCEDSPIIGDTCNPANTIGFNLGTPTVGNNQGALNPTGWATTGSDADTLVLSDGTGVTGTAGQSVIFDITGITNPTQVGTFYARIVTYSDSAIAIAYNSTSTGVNNPGTHIDDGGIALAVAEELTITARVQEVLEFCIGTETASTLTLTDADSCLNVFGTDLDLGVVGSTIATTSTIDAPNDGIMMIRTNAINGAVIYYKAEQDGSANGGKGALKINGSDCAVILTALNDPCFNSVGTTRAQIVGGTENFGLALKDRVTTTGGATDAVQCDTEYQGDGTAACTGAATDFYAWDDTGAFDTLASSSGPVDDELVALEFAATASPTTPTGLYTVTANFVATATF